MVTHASAAGVMTRAMFALLARQAHMLSGQTCTTKTADHAFLLGLDASKQTGGIDFQGFFIALQALEAHRIAAAGLAADPDARLSRLVPLVTSSRAGRTPGLLQALRTEAYAAACSGQFRHRLMALFRHYAAPSPGGLQLMDMCGACWDNIHHQC